MRFGHHRGHRVAFAIRLDVEDDRRSVPFHGMNLAAMRARRHSSLLTSDVTCGNRRTAQSLS
jgi:hypothetical protein